MVGGDVGPEARRWVGRAPPRGQDTMVRVPARCGTLRTASRFGNCWRCGRYGEMMPDGGGVGVGNGDGEFPSLADTIAAVRRELSSAQAAGQGQPVQFRTGPVELEFEVAVTRTGGGQAGVQIWVLTLGGKARAGACDHAADQGDAAAGEPGHRRGRADHRRPPGAGTGRAAAVAAAGARGIWGQRAAGAAREAAWGLTGTGSVSCTRRARMSRGPARGTGWVTGWCSPPGT